MSFESILAKITTPPSPDNVLVCEAGFSGLKGLVAEKKGQTISTGQLFSSELFDLDEAVEDIIKKAKQSGWRGQHVILINPAVCMSVIDLSIPPKNKLLVQQLEENIQWELEPTYNEYKNLLSIGQLLQLLGHINAEQLDEIVKQQNDLMNSKNSAVVYKRLGELAIEAGYITQKKLTDVLNRQQWFVSDGDSIKCGWHALPEQQVPSETGDYKWIVSGIKQDLLRSWQAAFSKQETKLEAVYPLVASWGLSDVEKKATDKQVLEENEAIVLEVHQGIVSSQRQLGDYPVQIGAIACTNETMLGKLSEFLAPFLQENDLSIKMLDCLNQNEQQSKELLNDVIAISERNVTSELTTKGKVTLPMRSALKNFLRPQQSGYVQSVSVHENLPPVMQRFAVRAVLAGLLVFALIITTELGLLASRIWFNTNIASISEDVSRIRDEKKRINKKINTVKKLEDEISKKETEKNTATTMISLLTRELPQRNQTLISLMARLQESMTDDIVVNNIKEDTLLGFDFDVWALSDQAAQQFIKRFQLAIHPMGYRIKNLTVKEGTGRLGLIGYRVDFSITPHSEEEWKARKQRANKRPTY